MRGVPGSSPGLPIGPFRVCGGREWAAFPAPGGGGPTQSLRMNALDVAYALAAAVTAPWWARKARGGWRERLGHIAALSAPEVGRPRVLLHGVSVGEVSALRGLVPMLRERADVVVCASTDTGLARARELYGPVLGEGRVVRYPLDASASVRRFLDAVRPDVVGLVELEVWPNFVAECRRRGIPIGVINGRLSPRSFRGYRRIRPLLWRTFASLAVAAVQDEAYAKRFRAMGVPAERVRVTGSMKWDAAPVADHVPGAEELAREMGIDLERPLVVAGSTAPGEDALLHAACPKGVQLMCAPRKPEWFDGAFRALGGEKACTRRSIARGEGAVQRGAFGALVEKRDRFLLDTIGELRKAYALADVVVVGRTFEDYGGSDPIEPAALGKPVIVGPHVGNFLSVVKAFDDAGGIVRTTRAGLAGELAALLADRPRRDALAARARECIAAQQGATARHAQILLDLAAARVSPSA